MAQSPVMVILILFKWLLSSKSKEYINSTFQSDMAAENETEKAC